ncbi:Nn.00g061390.m01.CDS01 [Neocucurbitaria sp. VM-36]
MTQNLHASDVAITPDGPGRNILPLPDEVVAQIKSSTAIVSLTGVVLGLLSNSLDAKASKIEATVDFARGGCTVEDDGLGILPVEFREEGGLGKMYCTSKYYSHGALPGRNGTFLAALAAMSLLTITSRHYEHRSHNTVTFLHSKATDRQLPACANHEVHGKHGTRVTVRNLFGNLPVRVKQRSLVADQKAELDRLWHGLKRHVTGLLLSWRGIVSLKMRDSNNRVILNFNTSNAVLTTTSHDKSIDKPHSGQLSSLLNILTQANYVKIDEWASWVPASASTPALSIKGAISLDPAPSKHVQFISLGISPISAETGQNELFDVVNRLFALSGFGAIEEDTDVDENEPARRQTNKRIKNEGYAIRQLKARKDVDRYPMFHLRICLRDENSARLSEDQLMVDDTSLQAVVEVLSAMITQWLSVHHFQPRQPRKRRDLLDNSDDPRRSIKNDNQSTQDSPTAVAARVGKSHISPSLTPTPRSTASTTRTRKRPSIAVSRDPSERLQHRAFAEWSRIKSANPSFFSTLPTLSKLAIRTGTGSESNGQPPKQSTSLEGRTTPSASFQIEPVPRGAFGASADDENPSESGNEPSASNDENETTLLWTDPSTKRTYLLNARTGSVMPETLPRPNTDSAAPVVWNKKRQSNNSIRLAQKPATALTNKTPWLDNMLQTWDNPVFMTSEPRIQQISLKEHDNESGGRQESRNSCSHFAKNGHFNEASATSSSRLSKQDLRNAEVIAQVDKKFILIKMRNASSSNPEHSTEDDLLVLVDQHAADERIKVESLLQGLCTSRTPDSIRSSYQSKLGHKSHIISITLDKPVQFTISSQEQAHFITHAARFATWGILYDIFESSSSKKPTPTPKRPKTSGNNQPLLSITSLPPTISARCTSDPQLLISLLRSTVWSYAEDPHLPPLPVPSLPSSTSPPSTSAPGVDSNQSDWPQRLATCPPALIDLINSRACRSAIMFNDQLSREECEGLVGRLAECVFPFMCAHGRPSMVPLVELGSIGESSAGVVGGTGSGSGDGGGAEREGSGFVEAWKAWRGSV